jgi:2',3'-cyclic-nucleotide 2'-phosphodiesterase (5'-nucleotidase family)
MVEERGFEMPVTRKRALTLLLGLCMLFSLLVGVQLPVFADPGDVEINILHTNDVHGRYEYVADSIIGIDRIAAIKKNMQTAGANPILVDVGDALHGMPIINLSTGQNAVNLMTSAGYDLMTPGNHDYNYGSARLTQLAGIAATGGMKMISANTFNRADGSSFLPQTAIVEIAGVKVGFFGLTTTTTPIVTHPDNVASLEFREYKASAETAIASLNAAGVDIIVGLAHVSRNDVVSLVSELSVKPDLIIDAHDHISTNQVVDGVPITSSGQYEANLGQVTITYNTTSGTLVSVSPSLIPASATASVVPDVATSDLLADIKTAFAADNATVIGSSAVELSSARPGIRLAEQPLGNLVSDAMREVSGADIAVFNGGGIRADIHIGNITRGDVYGVLPFNNYMVVKKATPADLKAIMELSLQALPADAGGFLQMSGMSVVYDLTKPAGSRVVSIKVAGNYLDLTDDQTIYTIAANDFMAAGGDGYTIFGTLATVTELDTLGGVFEKFIKESLGGTIPTMYAAVEGRILDATSETALNLISAELSSVILIAGDLNSENYTPASWQTLQTALASAEAINDDAEATYAQKLAALTDLAAAVDNLAAVEPVTPVVPPVDKPKTPATGDISTELGLAMMLIFGTLGAACIELDRKRKLAA